MIGTLLSFVIEASIGVWIGKILFFSFVGAPRTFEVLPREEAGDVVNNIFPTYYLFGIVLGVVSFLAGIVLGLINGYGFVLGVFFLGSGVGVLTNIYARQVLAPKIRYQDEFEKNHRRSVWLNGLVLVSIVISLGAIHLYMNPV